MEGLDQQIDGSRLRRGTARRTCACRRATQNTETPGSQHERAQAVQGSLPDRPVRQFSWTTPPDPLDHPNLFEGIILKRVVAYLVDVAILLGVTGFLWLLAILTLGLLGGIAAILTPLIPLAYHTILIGGADSATIGMRITGIHVRRIDGGAPDYPQAALLTLLFYASMALTGLLLIIAFFNERSRCLHDYLSGTITVVNIDPSAD
ncbi:MAG: RDD family protein [Rhodospirillales bacterium]|nr:MAG: RDD family protein [Rhodospirillales bacterium]